MKAILLVAGYATRLYPLTETRPKALLEVAGRPILNYILKEINTIDAIDEVIVISNDKFYSQFLEWSTTVKSKKPIKVLNDGSTSEENRLGAIGDIQFAIEQENIDDEMMIIAGDTLFTFKLEDYYKFYSDLNKDCAVAKTVWDIEQLKQFAVALLDKNGKIIELNEKPSEPNSDVAIFATYIYTKETVPLFKQYLDEGNKTDAPGYFVQWLYTKKDVYAYKMNGECYDVGNAESYEEVQEIFRNLKIF